MRTLTRRTTGVVIAAVVTLLAVGAVPALSFEHNANEAAILRLVNHARTSRGLHAVQELGALDAAALKHSRDMMRRDYFSHDTPNGLSVADRAQRAGYAQSGWSGWSVGECIAWGSGSLGSPKAIFRSWMHSKPHRAIILGKRWRDIGIGAARGNFTGMSGVCMYTLDVGRRTQ